MWPKNNHLATLGSSLEKSVVGISDQVQTVPGCTVTEDG